MNISAINDYEDRNSPMPNEPTLEVAVLSMKEWARRKSLDATNKHKSMRMSI